MTFLLFLTQSLRFVIHFQCLYPSFVKNLLNFLKTKKLTKIHGLKRTIQQHFLRKDLKINKKKSQKLINKTNYQFLAFFLVYFQIFPKGKTAELYFFAKSFLLSGLLLKKIMDL